MSTLDNWTTYITALQEELAEVNRKLDIAIAGLKQIRLINNAPACNAYASETLAKLKGDQLTPEQIRAMSARELDGMVAAKVMGFPDASVGGWDNPFVTPKPYSSSIAEAWELVEKMTVADYMVSVDIDMDGCAVSILQEDEVGIWMSVARASGTNVPRTLCEAALLAVTKG